MPCGHARNQVIPADRFSECSVLLPFTVQVVENKGGKWGCVLVGIIVRENKKKKNGKKNANINQNMLKEYGTLSKQRSYVQ